MKKEIIYSSGNYLRDEFKIEGYLFGKQSEGSEPAACIVGAMRGNEYQQLYICSQLVKRLKELENSGAIVGDNQILVIPCVNNFSMNVGMKYWVSDNSDINRQFPGNFDGEPTSRLAAHLFECGTFLSTQEKNSVTVACNRLSSILIDGFQLRL